MTVSEEWRPVVGYEGAYEVSNAGRVRSLDRIVDYVDGRRRTHIGCRLKLKLDTHGYAKVNLGADRRDKWVHIMVAEAFIGPRPGRNPVCHNNGDKTDNRLENLRYDTTSANLQDAVRHGTNYWANRTECPKKHPYSPENTLLYKGARRCRTCAREWGKQARARRRAQKKGTI